MNNPSRIQFTNGNVTKYIYSATGEKLRTIYQTAVPNITVAVGTAHELTASELLYTDSVDYYHGGRLTVKNGKLDKYYFDGGYAQAEPIAGSNNESFAFFYYNSDHLGNIREVIDEKGDVVQITNYYPFGTPYATEAGNTNADLQTHKYNGKEFDTMHGLNTYDYGARQYNALLGRWDRIDPLCEKYYSVSPYAYCANNPVSFVDINGCDSVYFQESGNELLRIPSQGSYKITHAGRGGISYTLVSDHFHNKVNSAIQVHVNNYLAIGERVYSMPHSHPVSDNERYGNMGAWLNIDPSGEDKIHASHYPQIKFSVYNLYKKMIQYYNGKGVYREIRF